MGSWTRRWYGTQDVPTARRSTPRDVRMGETWTLPQHAKNAVLRLLIRTLLALGTALPTELRTHIGRGVGHLAWLCWRRRARLTERRIARYLPSLDARRLARECFVRAGESLALTIGLRRRSMRASELVEIPPEAWSVFTAALDEGRGVVFVSGHLGPFEVIPAAIRERGVAASIVVRESYDPALDPVLDAHRLERGADVIHRGEHSAPRRILRALAEGRPVGLLPDLGARVPSAWAPFLADRALLPTGPARLAARARCPIVVGTLDPIAYPGYPGADSPTPRFRLRIERLECSPSVESTHRAIASALAKRIEAAPAAWLWMGAKSLLIADDDPGELHSWAISTSRWT